MTKSIAIAASALLPLALLVAVAARAQESGKPEPAQDVSIVQLIVNPEKYDGTRVVVRGFLVLEFEGSALYLHAEDFEHGIYRNGVWFAGDSKANKPHARKHVSVEATFNAAKHGHLGLWAGTLEDVQRVWE